jgi:VIT family
MSQTPDIEWHFTESDTIRDVVIGMSDGLTVPFALAAGLSFPGGKLSADRIRDRYAHHAGNLRLYQRSLSRRTAAA